MVLGMLMLPKNMLSTKTIKSRKCFMDKDTGSYIYDIWSYKLFKNKNNNRGNSRPWTCFFLAIMYHEKPHTDVKIFIYFCFNYNCCSTYVFFANILINIMKILTYFKHNFLFVNTVNFVSVCHFTLFKYFWEISQVKHFLLRECFMHEKPQCKFKKSHFQ